MIGLLINLLVFLLIVGLVYYVFSALIPLPPGIWRIVQVVLLVVVVVYLIYLLLGIAGTGPVVLR